MIKPLVFALSAYAVVAPTYAFANTSNLSFSYAQSVLLGAQHSVKLTWQNLVAGASGAAASAGSYVAYVRPAAQTFATVVFPRVLLAASGVGTAALVGYGAYQLWQHMQTLGYIYDPDSNTIKKGSEQVIIDDPSLITSQPPEFFNDPTSFYTWQYYYGAGNDRVYFSNPLDFCPLFRDLADTGYNTITGCYSTGYNPALGRVDVKVSYKNQQGVPLANTYPVYPNRTDPAKIVAPPVVPTVAVTPSNFGNALASGSSADLPDLASIESDAPSVYRKVIQDVFDPSIPTKSHESGQAIRDAQALARPALGGEVSPTVPDGAVSGSDALAPAIPNINTVTPSEGGSYDLPAFCGWAPVVCDAAVAVINFPSTVADIFSDQSSAYDDLGRPVDSPALDSAENNVENSFNEVASFLAFNDRECLPDYQLDIPNIGSFVIPISEWCSLTALFKIFLHLTVLFMCSRMILNSVREM